MQPPIPNDPDQLTLVDPRTLEVTLRKGYCLILNFRDFQGRQDKQRKGSEKDVSVLQDTFSHLGAEVRTCTNLTFDEVNKEILALQKIDWTKYDHLVVVIMSHGELGKFQTSGGEFFKTRKFREEVYACPLLFGKPKFFVINACRGGFKHPGKLASKSILSF